MRAIALATLLLCSACRGTGPQTPATTTTARAAAQEAIPLPSGDGTVAIDPVPLPPPERDWSLRWRFPVWIGYTEFDSVGDLSFDRLRTLSVVPTAELVRPLGRGWTLLPFLGLGAGWLVDEDEGIAILTTGVRAEYVHRIDERSQVRVVPRVRYDANLSRPDGLLGDWGRNDLAVELRYAFGRAGDRARFEPGVYAQTFWFWNDIDFDVPGVTPGSVDDQQELGLSFGTREPVELLGIALPRVFVGYRFGDGLETLSIRLGEL